MPLLRLGTRRSRLALAQSGMMQRAIGRALGVPEADIVHEIPLVEIVTTGDRIQDRRLLEVGGKALFTKEIEAALLAGEVDLAVHSMKDVPAEMPPGLALAAIPEREDSRDAFLSPLASGFDALPQGARLGTASLRRQAQALTLRPDLKVEMLRGNVDTRLARLKAGDFDAILLAVSGLNRLGFTDQITERLDTDAFLPAPGQGALALQTRSEDTDAAWARALNHADTAVAVAAERGAMRALEGSCRTAVGAHAELADGRLTLTAAILAPDASAPWRGRGVLDLVPGADPDAFGAALGEQVRAAAGDQAIAL
ncbi:MAG: hydroxymethylbilane synthase [Brevundimonas sp.]|uniref:hydroxymethylbilane synthase n=1 Tax=Brevundimonas sp. TaxID=1871086 RepID=UPI00391EF0FA